MGGSIDEVSNQIKGAAGSQVVFKIKRNEFIGSNVKTVTLTRQSLDASPQREAGHETLYPESDE